MRLPLLEHRFLIALAAGVVAITVITGSPVWFLNLMLLSLLCGVLVLTMTWPDRGFYLTCTGVLLVVSCGLQNIWGGLFVACMLAGIVCSSLGLLESRQDLRVYGFFCGGSFLIALLIEVSNHVLVPLLILGIIAAAIFAIQSIRIYQFRKHYSGA
jgi:hypothetical protein